MMANKMYCIITRPDPDNSQEVTFNYFSKSFANVKAKTKALISEDPGWLDYNIEIVEIPFETEIIADELKVVWNPAQQAQQEGGYHSPRSSRRRRTYWY